MKMIGTLGWNNMLSCESNIEDIFLTWLHVSYPVNWKTTPRLIRRLKTARQKLRSLPGDILIEKNEFLKFLDRKYRKYHYANVIKTVESILKDISRAEILSKHSQNLKFNKKSSSTQKLGQFQRQSRHFDWFLRTGNHDLQIKFR
jgi:hypothetical protein